MVKRQTVWLSTMMVLSLMLIGYYTLGTPPSTSKNTALGGSANNNLSGVTGHTVPASSTGIGQATNKNNAATTPTSSKANPSDWFVQATLDQMQQQSKVIQTLQNMLSDPRISQSAANSAYQQLTTIQSEQESASKIHDLLVGEGYPDSLVLFNPQHQVHIYVEAKSITPTMAVKVINLVSETLGMPSNQVIVTPHV